MNDTLIVSMVGSAIIGMAVGFVIGIVNGMRVQLKDDAAAAVKGDPFNYEWSIAIHRAKLNAEFRAAGRRLPGDPAPTSIDLV